MLVGSGRVLVICSTAWLVVDKAVLYTFFVQRVYLNVKCSDLTEKKEREETFRGDD